MTSGTMTGGKPQDAVLSSLEFIEKKGVPGAAECRRNHLSQKEAAKVLAKLFPRGRNGLVDKWLRDVHQLGLTRVGDFDLFLTVLADGKGDDKLAQRAKAAYLATPKGAVIADLKKPHHWFFYGSLVLCVLLSVTAAGLYFLTLGAAVVPLPPLVSLVALVAPPLVWIALKKTVLACFFAAMVSGRYLAMAAASTQVKKAKATKAWPYVELSLAATVLLACGLVALYMRTPLLFVAGCLLAVYLLRTRPDHSGDDADKEASS